MLKDEIEKLRNLHGYPPAYNFTLKASRSMRPHAWAATPPFNLVRAKAPMESGPG
jgi:hypothetical protein